MGGFAWVTLATNDSYSLGALVLANSLRRVNTAHQLVVLITPGVTEAMKTQLSAVFNVVKLVDVLDSGDADNLALLARPELGITFTKLHCWKLTQYDKCVFLDADTLVLQNSDELFEREELSAAPDAGWPDCFNSGVFVYKPSIDTFNKLIEFALIHGSFDGGDQGLLNLFFSDWATKDIKKHLPFVYNMVSTSTYSYLPAFKQFGQGLKIIHFIGSAKPWLQPFNTETGLVQTRGDSQHVVQFVQLWWDIFCTHVHPSLSTEMSQHRLSSSYDFSAPARSLPSTQSFSSFESQYSEPTFHPSQSNLLDDETYTYFDPWEEFVEQTDINVPQEIYQNYNSSLESYVDTYNSSEVNYSDHHSHFSDSQTHFSDIGSISVCRDSFSVPQSHTSPSNHMNNHASVEHSNYTDYLPTVEVSREHFHFHVPVNYGGGDSNLWNRPSRQNSFSQPERSVSAPEINVADSIPENRLPENQVVVETHSHASLPCERSSVVSNPDQHVSHSPSPESDAGLAGALASVKLGAPLSAEQAALEDHLRRQGWEQGNIDYMGKDSFFNIWQKICDTLASTRITPAETPAPVAPVAAPTYVSSVEISPSGPIDTSPPASYAPVSSSKSTTVVASDTDAAPIKAASAETATVVPETKSPSVTELVSSPAAVDSSDKSQPPSSQASSETSIPLTSTTPADSKTTDSAPAALLVSADPLGPKVQTSNTVVSEVQPPIVSSPEVHASTTTVEKAPSQVSAPEPDKIKVTEGPTQIQSVQAPIPLPVTPTETVVQTPVPLTSTQTETLVQTSVPLTSSPTTKIPDPTPSTPTETPIQTPIPLPATPTTVSVPVIPVESPVCTTPLPKVEPPATQSVPPVPESPQSPKDSAPPTPVKTVDLPLTPLSTPSSPQSTPVGIPDKTQAQPQTPTVTEPTPPTSPPIGAVESPLAAKLQVEADVPATPPVGGSSSQPALSNVPSEEPPVPPKRKGGSKSTQEVKGHKGKPAKGKK